MMWELFTQSYLRLLFPGIARKFGLVVAEGEGFGTCPPDVLQLLLVFLLRAVANTLSPAAMRQANEILASIGAMATPPGTNYRVDYGIPAGTGNVLKQMLLGSEGSLEMFHEAIRQSMMVPWRYHEVISLSLGLLKCWLFVDPLERPLHVRTKPRPFSAAPTSLFLPPLDAVLGSAGAAPSKAPQPAAAPKESESRLLYFLPRYIRYVRLIFLERKEPGDLEARLAKYREALVFLRATAMESFFTLDTTCWQTLLTSLLEIHRQTVLTKSEPYSLFGSTRNGDEFVGMVVETLLVSWIRSKTDDSRLWKSLYDQMSNANSTRYGRTVYEWAVGLSYRERSKP